MSHIRGFLVLDVFSSVAERNQKQDSTKVADCDKVRQQVELFYTIILIFAETRAGVGLSRRGTHE